MAKETTAEKPAAPAAPAAPKTFEETHAALIAAKINAGLTREAAVQTIKDQIANDAAKAKKK